MRNFIDLTLMFSILLWTSTFASANNTEKTVSPSVESVLPDTPEIGQVKTTYGISIAGVRITSDNAGDLSVIDGVSGTVTYDPVSKTLTLNEAGIDYDGPGFGIYNVSVEDLIIQLIGKNYLTTNDAGIVTNERMEISGTGTLIAVAAEKSCIVVYSKNPLVIKNCTIEATGALRGITGISTNKSKIEIDNATVKATGTKLGSIGFLKSFTLTNSAIITPEGAAFDEDLHAVAVDGEIVKKRVVIVPVYPLVICGSQVTSKNAGDLSVIEGVSGTVSYNPSTKTLTLNEATVIADNGIDLCIINQNVEGLNIELIGANKIEGANAFGSIFLKKDTKIKGTGSLITSNGTGLCIVCSFLLTIEDCTVSASGKINALYVQNLVVDNATVKAEGDDGSIKTEGLVLKNCAITAPEGAAFDPDIKGVALEGEIVKEQVVISPTTAIKDLESADIAVYPNPVNETLHIDMEEHVFNVEIYNVKGDLVLKDSNNKIISTTQLSSGMYILKLITEKGIYSGKIVKK